MMQSEKGFTLIELMVVVAIIGSLSLIAIPAYQNYAKKSSEVACMAETKAFSDKLFIELNAGAEFFDGSNSESLSSPTASACKTLVYTAKIANADPATNTSATEAKLANITGVVKNPVDTSRSNIICELGEIVDCKFS